jgi:hypothetical protein
LFWFAVQHLHRLGYHLGEIFGLAAFIIKLIGPQAAFQENQFAFMQVLLANFAQPSPRFDIDPFGMFLGFSFSRFPAVADCQAELGHLLPGECGAALGILAKTAYQLYSI